MSARARENLYKTPRPSDPRLEIVSDENDSDSSTRGKGVKRFSTGVGPQAPKARKKSSGILSSFSGFFRSIFGSSEEEEDSFEKDLSNRGVLHASNSDKTMSSSSDIIYEGRNHSPDVLCTSSKKSVLKHQPKQLELEESQDEEEIEVIDEVHNSRPSDLLNDRKSIDEMLEAVKAADVVLGDDDESSSGSISIISDNLNGAKGSSPCPEDSISRQNTPNRFRADDFHTPRTDSWARRRRTREHPIPRVKTPARSSERTASKSFKANSVYHTPENLGSFLDGAGSLLAYDKLLKDRLSASARRTPSGYIDKPKTEVRRVRTISVNYVLRAKSAMRKHRSRQASEVITLEDDIKRESPLIVLDDEPSSNKSETASISSYLSSGREKVDDLIASIASINLKTNGALEQYNKYKTSRKYRTKQERELEETNRQLQQIRNLHEVDLAEDVRQKLALGGIRPPLPKPKVKEEFPDLPPEALELCERAWISGSPMEVFCEGFDIKILRKDLVTLKPGAWLNDEVIVFFLSLVVDRSKNDASLPKTYTFNTFFYVNISTKGYASVKRWTRKVDIFAYDVLLIPVHVGGVHWCMAIVDFGEKTIEYFDSLGGSDNGALSYIQNYLREESKDKKKIEFDFSDWEFIIRSDCPRQSNGFDCGVFSVHVAEYCSRRAQLTFSQKHMEYFRKRMVYEIVSKKLM